VRLYQQICKTVLQFIEIKCVPHIDISLAIITQPYFLLIKSDRIKSKGYILLNVTNMCNHVKCVGL